jgi:hypothetical protein
MVAGLYGQRGCVVVRSCSRMVVWSCGQVVMRSSVRMAGGFV